MKTRSPAERVLFNISRFISFFMVISFATTTTILLFLRDMTLDEALIRENGLYAFINILFLTVIGCILDEIRRNQTIDRPVKRIIEAMDKIMQGDFSVRVDANHKDFSQAGYREIIIGVNKLAKELSGLETLRTDFVASVSHELKTPLAVIQNYAYMLRKPDISAQTREEYTIAICQTTQRLADLVANVLKLNKLEHQQIFPDIRLFDLGEQLAECLLSFETAWEEKQLSLDCDIQDNVILNADPELLRLAWNNLFSNAIKFTPQGGTISVRLETDDCWAVVAISDSGCGMTKETGARIFEKFYQGDTAHSTKGNGLGLALVKRIVDITGGVITVNSTFGKGSTFTVRLERTDHGTV